MCKISIIDYALPPKLLKSLLLLNSIAGNEDGFGFFTQKGTIYRDVSSFVDVADEYIESFPKTKDDTKGIYHVRAASVKTTLRLKDTHPHVIDNTIVFHNGTLNFRYTHESSDELGNLFLPDDIDSAQYTTILNHFSKDTGITLESIKKATNFFTGAFVLVQQDLRNPKKIWISRGRDRFLHVMRIRLGGDSKDNPVVGMIFNTSFQELRYIIMMLRIETKLDLWGTITELRQDTTYSYEFGSFDLKEEGHVPQDSTYKLKNYGNGSYNHNKAAVIPEKKTTYTKSSSLENLYGKIIECGFNLYTVSIICKLVFGIHFAEIETDEELNELCSLLTKIQKYSTPKKESLWIKIKELGLTELDIYNNFVHFPFQINSERDLKDAITEIKDVLSTS